MKKERTLLAFTAIYFLYSFGRNLFFPSTESQSSGLALLSLLLHLAMVVGLIGLSVQILRSTARPIDAVGPWVVWPVLGLAAALGIGVLKLSGRSTDRLPARAIIAAEVAPTITPAPGMNYNQLDARMHLIAAKPDCQQKAFAVNSTVWVRERGSDAYHPQKITRADLHDYNEKMSALLAAIDRVLTAMDVLETSKEEESPWRTERAMASLCYEQTKLLEANWEEWYLDGVLRKTGEAKPWQKEAAALQSEIDAARKAAGSSTKEVRL